MQSGTEIENADTNPMIINGLIILLSLVSGILMLWRIPRSNPGIEKSGDWLSGPVHSTVSIIIPARNEALRLPPLLASLQMQDIKPHELIVVDDQSTDATARIASDSGAIVIHAEQLDDSWIGKTRACWSGALAATGDWLLFLDADTRLDHPDSLSKILKTFEITGGRGGLSLQPYHTVKRLYESLSAIFNIIMLTGMSVFTPWGERLRGAGLFGPCLICRRDEYFAVGGHEVIRGSVIDDLALGKSFRRNGLSCHCFSGHGLISFRMYPEGFGQLIEGWSKNFCTAAPAIHPVVFTLILLWICGGFSIITLLLLAFHESELAWIMTAVAAYLSYAAMMVWLARKTGNFHPLFLFIFPVQNLFFVFVFLWSAYLTKVRRSVSWRGRKIKV